MQFYLYVTALNFIGRKQNIGNSVCCNKYSREEDAIKSAF
jgi:hypothetical protein